MVVRVRDVADSASPSQVPQHGPPHGGGCPRSRPRRSREGRCRRRPECIRRGQPLPAGAAGSEAQDDPRQRSAPLRRRARGSHGRAASPERAVSGRRARRVIRGVDVVLRSPPVHRGTSVVRANVLRARPLNRFSTIRERSPRRCRPSIRSPSRRCARRRPSLVTGDRDAPAGVPSTAGQDRSIPRAQRLSGLRVAVTGGAGNVGSHLVDAALREGARGVLALDALRGRPENQQQALASGRAHLVHVDITHADALRHVLAGCDVVFHQAALRWTRCQEAPGECQEAMVDGTFDVAEVVSWTSSRASRSHPHPASGCIVPSRTRSLAVRAGQLFRAADDGRLPWDCHDRGDGERCLRHRGGRQPSPGHRRGRCHWLARPSRARALTAALERALDRRELLPARGEEAARVARERFDGRRNDRMIIDLLLELVDRSGTRVAARSEVWP